MNEENIRLIWSVIQKNKQLQNISYDGNIEQLKYFSSTLCNVDLTKNMSKLELVDFNKKYLAYIVRTNKQNNIIQEDMFIPYTNEELHNIKREKFNDELTKKQVEFSQYTQKMVPPSPLTFLEENDKPIHKMEELISQTIAQRELDVVTFQKYHPPPQLLQKQQKQQQEQEQPPPRLITIMSSSFSDETNLDDNIQPIILEDLQQEDYQEEKIKEKNTINRHISWEDEQLSKNKLDELEEKMNIIYQLLNKIDMKLEKSIFSNSFYT